MVLRDLKGEEEGFKAHPQGGRETITGFINRTREKFATKGSRRRDNASAAGQHNIFALNILQSMLYRMASLNTPEHWKRRILRNMGTTAFHQEIAGRKKMVLFLKSGTGLYLIQQRVTEAQYHSLQQGPGKSVTWR